MTDTTHEWLSVHRGTGAAELQEMALVLAALGVDYWLRREGPEYVLLVPNSQAAYARRELDEYLEEQATWPPPERPVSPVHAELRDVVGFWVVLVTAFYCQQNGVFGLDWLEAGKAHAGQIVAGEWWRTITALTLHADGPHLFGNLLFGTLFGFLVSQEVGRGVGWLAALVAGAVGNGLNAWVQPAGHTSVGASTAVFAAIGMTVALQWRHHAGRRSLLQRWSPVIIGLVFLGFLGTAGPRTDVLAHVLGLISGLNAGGLLNRLRPYLGSPGNSQGWLEALALVLIGVAWWMALQHAGS